MTNRFFVTFFLTKRGVMIYIQGVMKN